MNSFLSYLGGKSLLTKKIIPKIPKHHCYCEVFSGAAWLLFRKEESKVEIINDINSDLITLYRVVKNHLDEFVRYLRWLLVSRDEFARFKGENPETLTDIQKAVRYYYLLKNSYASRMKNPNFGIATTTHPKFNLLRIEEDLSTAHLRLANVYIENMHYSKLIKRFDRPHAFFYIDPPYYNHENDYGNNIFSKEDFGLLKNILSSIEGKFLMSINDIQPIRKLFKDFIIEEVKTTYSVSGANKKHKKANELLIRNYEL